jgi:hypothetical protein
LIGGGVGIGASSGTGALHKNRGGGPSGGASIDDVIGASTTVTGASLVGPVPLLSDGAVLA